MKHLFYILSAFTFASVNAMGQEVKSVAPDSVKAAAAPVVGIAQPESRSSVALCPDESALSVHPAVDEHKADTLRLPRLDGLGRMPIGLYPMGWGGLFTWELHEGLNVNLGASVFGSFGKNARRGVGFAQNITAMYAVSLTNSLSLAVGGYFNNMYWGNSSYRDGGVNAVLGFKFDDHWEGYLYGQKSVLDKRLPLPLYDINGLGDRIGAAVRYKFNDKFSVTVSVEDRKR